MTKASEPIFELTGGALALDFANSIEKRPMPEPLELLAGYSDLIAWAAQAGIVNRDTTERLRAVARRRMSDAQRVFLRAVRLREAIFRTFSAIAAGRQVDSMDVDTVRREALAALQHGRLVRNGGAFQWEFPADREALDSVLWPIAKNAADLLSDSESLRIVRECASDKCAWLFLDRSRNRTRRWCDMKVCGNRAKSRSHYRRVRLAAPGGLGCR